MNEKRNTVLRILLYISSFLILFVGVYFHIESNMLGFFITSILSLSIYTYLIAKNYKFLSPISSITFLLISIFISGMNSTQLEEFDNADNERIFMVTFALVQFFYIIVGVIWYMRERVWKKITGIIFLIMSSIFLLAFGTQIPDYYQNFVYTRLFLLIYFLFNIFLIVKGKVIFRIFGILGILLSIGMLIFSASLLAEKTYVLEGEDKQEVLDFVDAKGKEMLNYYNEDMFEQGEFCKYCGPTLISMMYSDPKNLLAIKETYGDYISIGEPSVTRSVGIFYIEYPVTFENIEGTKYVVFALEGITSDYDIYGFAITDTLGGY